MLAQLTSWFAQEPMLCFSIAAGICAAIYPLSMLYQDDGDISLFFGDGDGD